MDHSVQPTRPQQPGRRYGLSHSEMSDIEQRQTTAAATAQRQATETSMREIRETLHRIQSDHNEGLVDSA